MAFNRHHLRRMAFGGCVVANQPPIPIFHYASNDAHAAVAGANYFDAAAADLKLGSVIFASLAMGGTPQLRAYIVTANTGTAVTIALQTVA